MKRVIILIAMVTALVFGANDKQFYFIGKYSRIGSISNVGANSKGVFLRWDVVEGKLPSEITTLELIKEVNDTNSTLLSVPSNALMSEAEIVNLFKAAENERSLFEIIEALSKNEDSACKGANLSNYANKIRSCLQSNSMWSFLASKVNFDIARVRYRAYLDKNVNSSWGSVKYYLVGKNSINSILLGKVDINLNSTKSVLEPKNFKQIITSRCNDNRFGLDDFRVALFWENGGDNRSEKFINSLMVGGYDIYYSTKPVSQLSANFNNKDIAALAKSVGHNAKGEVDLSSFGLKKANKTVITPTESNSSKPIYLEDKQELIKRGFLPGEERYYFLVVRDFSANYGPTKVLKVKIPDLLPPAKPLSPTAIENNGSIELFWIKPTLKSYLDYYKNDLKVCLNLSLPKVNRYAFVDTKESCLAENSVEENFNIEKYYVYRFENFDEAAKFEDSDLDGYSDIYEEQLNTNSCDKNSYPPNKIKNHLVGVVFNSSSSEFISFKDTNITKSQVYWYKIVSVTKSGVKSIATAPIRAFVPKRGLVDAPEVKLKKLDGYKMALNRVNGGMVLIIDTSNTISKILIDIAGGVYELDKNGNEFSLPVSIVNKNIDGTQSSTLLFYDTKNNFVYDYVFTIQNMLQLTKGESGSIVGVKEQGILSYDTKYINEYTTTSNSCVTMEYDPNYLQYLQNSGSCIDVMEFIGNNFYRTKRICNPTQNQTICNNGVKNGDLITYRISEYRKDGRYSHAKYFNVLYINKDTKPVTAQISSLTLDKTNSKAKVVINYGLEKVASIYVKLYKDGSDEEFTKLITNIDKKRLQNYEAIFDNINFKNRDSWCAQAKVVGINNVTSNWSTPICKEVTKISSNEDAMPWPKVRLGLLKKDTKEAFFDNKNKAIYIKLTKFKPIGRDNNECDLAEAVHSILNFVVYRQTIFSDGTKSKFVQVSPIVDTAKASCADNKFLINDPNLEVADYNHMDSDGMLPIYFVDRYPFVAGNSYKYIILYKSPLTKEFSAYAISTVVAVP